MIRTILSIALTLALWAVDRVSATDMFEIHVKVHYDSDDAEQVGTGMILIEEGDYAHVNVIIFESGSLRLSTAQSRSRSGGLSDRQGKVTFSDELTSMIDLSLSPRERKHGNIRVTGDLEIMSRVPGRGKPSYEFRTEPISFVVEDDEDFTFGTQTGSGVTELEIAVRKSPYMHPDREEDVPGWSKLLFETEYTLFNDDNSDYEVKAYKCLLGSEGDYSEGKRHCSWHEYYPVENGDSLLYWFSYDIDDIDWVGGDEFIVTIDFSRCYAVNAQDFDPDADHNTFNNATFSLFSKEVRTKIGEVLDVILDDRPSRLPFDGRETIRLISRTGK